VEPDLVAELRREVRALRAQHLSDERLKELIGDQLGCDYWPPGDGLTYSTWLAELEARLPRTGEADTSAS
jgi:hypothetical protein